MPADLVFIGQEKNIITILLREPDVPADLESTIFEKFPLPRLCLSQMYLLTWSLQDLPFYHPRVSHLFPLAWSLRDPKIIRSSLNPLLSRLARVDSDSQ